MPTHQHLAPALNLALLLLPTPPAGANATTESGRITAERTGGTGDDDVMQLSP